MNLEIGNNLKKYRKEKDMTQEELAQALSLSAQAVSRYETGAAYPDIEMLPVIAGYFGVTVDELLGVSSALIERRKEEYDLKLRTIQSREERLALLRRKNAEFPGDWATVSNMIYEMKFIPELLPEMRDLVRNAMEHCFDILWRENIFICYLQAESDEEKACDFIVKWASKYDMRRPELFRARYSAREMTEKLIPLEQMELRDGIKKVLISLTMRKVGVGEAMAQCERALSTLDALSECNDRTKPDLWVDIKLMCLLRLSNNCFVLGQTDEGFYHLETAVSLLENLFSLPNGTLLTYGSSRFDRLKAKSDKEFYYSITEFTGPIADSMMMRFVYESPLGYVEEDEEAVYDMEGFESLMLFSYHTYDIIRNAFWDGFAKVKEDQCYKELLARVKAVSSFENPNNILLLMESAAKRTDDYIKDIKCEWYSGITVPGVGVYTIAGDNDIPDKIELLKREHVSNISQITTVRMGGGLIPPPAVLLDAICKLDIEKEDFLKIPVMLKDEDGKIIFKTVGEL